MTAGPVEMVHAAGTIRRVQALAAAGYPLGRLSNWVGVSEYRLTLVLNSPTVPVVTARLVASLFNRLALTDPTQHGISPHSVSRAKARAAAAGWAPEAAWDDDTIDDPAAIAQWTGHCGTARGVDLHARHDIPLCPPCRAALERRRLRNQARELRALTTTRA